MTLVVILAVRKEAVDQFRVFERKAATVMAKHGGAIERTVVISPTHNDEFLKEVHIVTFPNQGAFAAYQQDEDLKPIAHLRQGSVVSTQIMAGEDGPNYSMTR